MGMTIDELEIKVTADINNATTSVDTLSNALSTLNDKLNMSGISSFQNSLKSLSNAANSATKSLQTAFSNTSSGISESVKKISNKLGEATDETEKKIRELYATSNQKSKSGFLSTIWGDLNKGAKVLGTIGAYVGATKKITSAFEEWFDESSSFTETQNLFNVTMGEGVEQANKYAQTVSKLVGIDIKEWMNFQGTFKQLASGFGVADEKANLMSQNLTQLSYDIASMFNVKTEEAFDKLSSAMAGQVKGLRDFGIDVSVATLKQYALSKGIETSVRSMSQADKALLRYNYILENSIDFQGDMARTLITPANSMRILSAQIVQMKRALGGVVSVIAVKVIPYFQAFTKVIKNVAEALAKFFGFEPTSIDYSSLGKSFSSGFEEADDTLDSVSNKIKKVKKSLMGFDELNIISSPTQDADTSASTGVSSVLGDMELSSYDFLMGLEEQTDKLTEKMEKVLKVVGLIGGAFAIWKISESIFALPALIDKIKWSSLVQNMVEGFSQMKAAGEVTSESLNTAFKGPLTTFIGFATVVGGIALMFSGLKDILENGLTPLNTIKVVLGVILVTLGAMVATIGLGFAAAAPIVGLIAAIVSAVVALGVIIYKYRDEIKAWLEKAWAWMEEKVINPIIDFFSNLWKFFDEKVIKPIVAVVKPIFEKLFEIFKTIIQIYIEIYKAIYNYIIKPVVEWVKKAFNFFNDNIFKPIKELFSKIGTWVYDHIIKPIVDKFLAFKEWIIGIFKAVGETVVTFIVDTFKKFINGLITLFENKINMFITLLNGAVDLINKIPGVSIKKIEYLSIPRLADGGFINEGQMFIAREAGPELVGNIGRKSAVINNAQIIQGIENAVYRAISTANFGGNRTETVNVNIDGQTVGKAVVGYVNGVVRQTGNSPLLV